MNNVTLACVDCVDPVGASKVLDICRLKADFGQVKLLTDKHIDYDAKVPIMPLKSLTAYSVFMLTHFHKYIETDHVLVVQRDGWILNADRFDPDWLKLDYIAPLFMQFDRVGSGGFSMRSRRIMQEASKIYGDWDGTLEEAEIKQREIGMYEDGILSLSMSGYQIASNEQGAKFGQGGNRNPKYFMEYPFGFHRTFSDIDFETGRVDFTDLSRDITQSYDKQIDSIHKNLTNANR